MSRADVMVEQRDMCAEHSPGPFRPTHLIAHYNEVALKGKNRRWFEDRLVLNMRHALASAAEAVGGLRSGLHTVRRLYGRLVVFLDAPKHADDATSDEAIKVAVVLSRVFGIAYLMPVVRLPPDLEPMKKAAEAAVGGMSGVRSFAVKCRRATKNFPFTSIDVQRELGAHVQRLTGWKVDLERPERVLRVECLNKDAFLGVDRIDGPGGLPTGVAGKVACLLSGGIDSPVAAYRLLRRGATVVYVHFHSHPYTGAESQEKVRDLAEMIQPPGLRSRLYLVPFADLQRRIAAGCAASLRILLYRRFMFRAAEAIARKEGAKAIVTGENLGQVASQTLENLQDIDAVTSLPVLRPLIGHDKLEIVAEAQEIGTFQTSIEPHGDCCSFLQPPNPATYSTAAELEVQEKLLDVDEEVATLLSSSQVVEIQARPLPPQLAGGSMSDILAASVRPPDAGGSCPKGD